MTATRFRDLPTATAFGRDFPLASTRRARLLGLSYLPVDEAGPGLLIPRCRSIHTFGMRFALDLVFLGPDGRVCAVRRGVPRRRLAWDRRARAVLELPANSEFLSCLGAGPGGEFLSRSP